MSYFAEPNHIEYDAWFDENVDPLDLMNYSDEKEFSDSVHFKFHKMSTRNLTIGSSFFTPLYKQTIPRSLFICIFSWLS